MSLKIWLPLCDNNDMLKNLGISQLTWITTGLNVVESGKIGGYSHSAQTTGQGLSAGPITIPENNQISICAWANFLDTTRSTGYVCGFGNPTKTADFMIARHSYSGIGVYLGGSQQLLANATTYDYNMQGWTHVAATYDGTKLKLYVNGQFVKEEEITVTIQSTNYFLIGTRSTSTAGSLYNSTYVDAEINDVRYYDHCLSAAEVREIANGLVLHYKLDGANENLLYDTPKLVDSNKYLGLQLNLKENLIAGDTYTLQLWDVSLTHEGKSAAQMNLGVYHGGGSVQDVKFTKFDVEEDHYAYSKYLCATFTAKSGSGTSNAWLNFYNSPGSADGTKYMHIGSWKLEKGAAATAWSNQTIDLTAVIDSSGYSHHGTSANSVTYLSNSIRYISCLSLNGTNQYINCWRGGMVRDAITVNIWAYMDTWSEVAPGRMVSCTQSGGWNFEGASNYPSFACGTGLSSNTYKNATADITFASLSPGWHMFTGTWDGFVSRIYIDGDLHGSNASPYTTHTPIWYNSKNSVFLGTEAQGTATGVGTPYFAGQLSDFRIYCTPLLDTDIKQLYNVSMKIDNKNNIHIFETVENSNNNKINKQGQLICDEINEINFTTNVKNFSNNKWYAHQIIER